MHLTKGQIAAPFWKEGSEPVIGVLGQVLPGPAWRLHRGGQGLDLEDPKHRQ